MDSLFLSRIFPFGIRRELHRNYSYFPLLSAHITSFQLFSALFNAYLLNLKILLLTSLDFQGKDGRLMGNSHNVSLKRFLDDEKDMRKDGKEWEKQGTGT